MLSLSGGQLEGASAAARRLVVASDTAESIICSRATTTPPTSSSERCAHRLAPRLLLGRARVIFGEGYDMAATYPRRRSFDWRAEESLMAACDAVTFTTAPWRASTACRRKTGILASARPSSSWMRFTTSRPASPQTPRRILAVADVPSPQARLSI